MKTKDIKALHEQTITQLQKQLVGLQQQLAQNRIKKHARKLENTSLVKLGADDIARIKTIIKERQIAQQMESAKEKLQQKTIKAVAKEKSETKSTKKSTKKTMKKVTKKAK
ncbi:MAG: 50S ribosomal protein L29 [Candidatus Pacebacteria bacterium RIFOXYB1_FULL_39_46]|nr:MAG: 50S ribosomal protein L29 [Candidatus Pacebacteria bacterium RIFOXYB1_FULL_39_46]OGJ39011.1 MAG: 50S ribosomal protein L29 [Candidatus Pacebacteria bacterium RIFOXYA1_FULL_38_18]OGJ39982.1 MAG: 50S ribosomal protein L29 [Candidatus Pacebacteria bacterium RIFOXYD1_FULL_39_27]OGJ40756.1 MAG: 50S ribosomal protein L29 [Candidatus Pacebacteria bacterium RIFOXYC1_FULL_39_21]